MRLCDFGRNRRIPNSDVKRPTQ